MAYYDFLLNQWILGNITEVQVNNAVTLGYITQTEADVILATPQV